MTPAGTASDARGPSATTGPSDALNEPLPRRELMKREMLETEGGTISTEAIAERLGIDSTHVLARAAEKRLFWLPGRDTAYPVFQLGERRLLPGISEVLAAFHVKDPWMRVHFTLTGDPRLAERRPIDVLRSGAVEEVVEAARASGEQLGA